METEKKFVKGCQRCGTDHEIEFRHLTNPADEWNWWGVCPVTNEPVLMRFVEE